MQEELLTQLIELVKEQIRLLQIMSLQLEKVNDSVHQVFLK
jgi:hypothetical protein